MTQYDEQLYVIYDYHFMVQTKTGTWAHKQGWKNAAVDLGYIDPEDDYWDRSTDGDEFYNSDCIFFACTR